MKVIIIIPAFNEAKSIGYLLKKILELKLGFDVVVVNDASQDETAAIVKKMGVKIIELPMNLGIGGAMQTGYIYANIHNYDIAIQVDGDGQHNPEHISELIRPIINGAADMVIGSRFIEKNGYQSTLFRRIGIGYLRLLIFLLTGRRFTDPTSGFRACNDKVIDIFSRYYPVDYPEPETVVMIGRNGFGIKEIPVEMEPRKGGESSIRSLKALYYMVKVSMAVTIDLFKKNEVYGRVASGAEVASVFDRT